MKKIECIVVGAGVIGSAVARSLLKQKKVKSVAVIEKEVAPAMHTSGRNSGVVHSGFNPKPGTLKAKFCVEGNRRMRQFCEEKKVPLSPVGTLVVALNQNEVPVLEEIHRRGVANGVPGVRIIDGNELRRLEPNSYGVAALHSPSGGITSGKMVTQALVDEAKQMGCEFFYQQKVRGIEIQGSKIQVRTNADIFETDWLFNCAGLYADEVAHKMGVGLEYTIIPFRGEYFKLKPAKKDLVASMIYPVPDLNYPFLGVHWTKMITGDLMIGPSATMAFGRESYKALSIGWEDTLKMFSKANFWNMFRSADFRRLAWSQICMSFDRKKFIAEAQRLVKGASVEDFESGKNGNRAQMVNRQGNLVDDILVKKEGASLHVLNAVSPGFTCSLPFADYLVDSLLN